MTTDKEICSCGHTRNCHIELGKKRPKSCLSIGNGEYCHCKKFSPRNNTQQKKEEPKLNGTSGDTIINGEDKQQKAHLMKKIMLRESQTSS